MKFGETLYQRSVPQWATYNVKYNELKHLIKTRTSNRTVVPVTISTAGSSRWQDLEAELYRVVKQEHDNVSLFLRSKQGEIERRLSHLEKQVKITQSTIQRASSNRPILQARKYQRLIKEAEGIGDEIENLSRFTSVQKTAFRKILKKYRKWTGSTALQQHLDRDVFSQGALQLDYADYFASLSNLSKIISTQLAGPMLSGDGAHHLHRSTAQPTHIQSKAQMINTLSANGLLHFDAALRSVSYGEVAGSARYWIHPDNLEQAEALLLRHMRHFDPQSKPRSGGTTPPNGAATNVIQTHQAIYDNLQRFAQDNNISRPSRIALLALWNEDVQAIVTLASLAPNSDDVSPVNVKRKDLATILRRSSDTPEESSPRASPQATIRSYMSEHRDVKPLAELHSARSRYVGLNNTNEIGTYATLDSAIHINSVEEAHLGSTEKGLDGGKVFPYAVLHVRWEFSRMPQVVRQLDSSHLAERVHDFSLEAAAIQMVHTDVERPKWVQLLETDIRKVPPVTRNSKSSLSTRVKASGSPALGVSSGPSSYEGPSDNIFTPAQGQSSATSLDLSPIVSTKSQPTLEEAATTKPSPKSAKKPQKRRTRIVSPAHPPRQRYWNEFDDADSDVNPDEGYAIYLDPNEPSFPGAETVSKVFGAMYDSLSKGRSRVASWLPMKTKEDDWISSGERTPLLFGSESQKSSRDAEMESSGSETEYVFSNPKPGPQRRRSSLFPAAGKSRPQRHLSRKQKQLERILFRFYVGLIVVGYLLLVMAGTLLATGRKKKRLEVDAGVITGVVAAEACAGISIVLVCMRRKSLGPLHWGVVAVSVTALAATGVAEMTLMLGSALS